MPGTSSTPSPATQQITNWYSSGSRISAATIQATSQNNLAAVVAGGAYTAGVLQTVLQMTGPGTVPTLTIYAADATSRSIRARLTIDGVIVFDATSSVATLNFGMVISGQTLAGATAVANSTQIQFAKSFLLEASSNLSEAAAGIVVAYARC